jgi:FAD/FMN-containing dehydrogenase
MLKERQLSELADIVGEDYFSSEEYMRKLYSQDIAALPGLVHDLLDTSVAAVAQPTTSEVVANLLTYCLKERIPLVPRGHGTSGYGGVLPTKGGIVVEMTRMNEIYNIDKENMTVEVGAGIIWGKLIEDLEDEGLAVAAYPSSAPSSTVGGWVAAGGTGIGSTKYGGISQQVVDLEVVLPDGQIIKTTEAGEALFEGYKGLDYMYHPGTDQYQWGPPGHDKPGPNVTELFVDSNGTLGIITKVTLKIIPLRTIQPMAASFRSRKLMIGAMKDILEATRPFYLHFITSDFYRMLGEVDKAPDTIGEWIVLSTYEGSDAEVAGEVEKFHHFVSRYGGTVESTELAHHEWAERFYPLRIKRLGPSLAPSEVYVPLEHLDEYLDHLDRHFKGEKYAVEGAIDDLGEVAALAWFLDDERRKISFLMGWYRSLDFIKLGLEHGGRAYSIGMWNAGHSLSYYGRKNFGLMERLKSKTDPKNRLNPGKVFPASLNLSLRFNLLILLAATIAVPVVLWFAWLLVPDLLIQYVPWLMLQDIGSVFIALVLGLVAGVVVIEIANIIPITFLLAIGGHFMRWGRKIFKGKK